MNRPSAHIPALVLIDLQKGWEDTEFWGGNRNNPQAEDVAKNLLKAWRKMNFPIFHVIHASKEADSRLHPDHPGYAMIDGIDPRENEPVIVKNVNSAFIGTDLKERLDAAGLQTLVIAGLTTNHCVSTTTRMAGNFGYRVYLIEDGTATFDRKGPDGKHYDAQLVHETALASLHGEFATVVNSQAMLQHLG